MGFKLAPEALLRKGHKVRGIRPRPRKAGLLIGQPLADDPLAISQRLSSAALGNVYDSRHKVALLGFPKIRELTRPHTEQLELHGPLGAIAHAQKYPLPGNILYCYGHAVLRLSHSENHDTMGCNRSEKAHRPSTAKTGGAL